MDQDHWPAHARSWALLGPPLRPSPEDVATYERVVAGRVAPRALLLGVTPELATMTWPAGTALTAIDRSPTMIGALFPTRAGEAIAAEWTAIPRPDAAFDVILGDGAVTCFTFPEGHAALGLELRRVLAPGGEVVLRLFASPARAETLDDVARDLRAGAIAGFHALKWRLAMAIPGADRRVRVTDILAAFDAIVPDRAALPWRAEVVGTIDNYRGSEAAYSFPTVEAQVAALGVPLTAIHTPTYELGDRCPMVVLGVAPR